MDVIHITFIFLNCDSFFSQILFHSNFELKYQYIIKNYFLILYHFDSHVLLTEFIITNEFIYK